MVSAASIDTATTALLRGVVADWSPTAEIVEIRAITPDASRRRYYRLTLILKDDAGVHPVSSSRTNAGVATSVVAMIFDSTAAAEVVGQADIGSDSAYVELTQFFGEHDIRIPSLLFDARERAVLLVEDVGEDALADRLVSGDDMTVTALYRQAIDQICALQRIVPDHDVIAFQRAFTRELYVREMREFTEFLLPARNCPAQAFSLCITVFDTLAAELDALPKVLCHRDFHSWNLMVDYQGVVRVIDFQDALLGTAYYDIASLLNDRDTDALLGPELCAELLEYFFKESAHASITDFARVLLQRDLKVAGRFAKLVQQGKPQYGVWIEGTVARIGRMLLRLARGKGGNPLYGLLYEELRRHLPEIR